MSPHNDTYCYSVGQGRGNRQLPRIIDATVPDGHVPPAGNMERNQPPVAGKPADCGVELPAPQAGKVVRTFGILDTDPEDEAPKRRVRLSAVLDED
jgi:hypothetical protein